MLYDVKGAEGAAVYGDCQIRTIVFGIVNSQFGPETRAAFAPSPCQWGHNPLHLQQVGGTNH